MEELRILVTGSAGHLGEGIMHYITSSSNHISSLLLQNSTKGEKQYRYKAFGLDCVASQYTNFVGSILDKEFISDCFDKIQIDIVIHCATLHKPHVVTHSKEQFIQTNIQGTCNLLEECLKRQITRFVFTSSTTVFGKALSPPISQPAAWIDETVEPIPKNIYGVTKFAAENICQLFNQEHNMSCVILRTSRFFLEPDDDKSIAESYDDMNTKVNEYLYRRVDLEDVVHAHLLAAAKTIIPGVFDTFIISATTPLRREDLSALRTEPASVISKYNYDFCEEYFSRNWRMVASIDRVYDNTKAREVLNWHPKYDFAFILSKLKDSSTPDQECFSELTRFVGIKSYHRKHPPTTAGPDPLPAETRIDIL